MPDSTGHQPPETAPHARDNEPYCGDKQGHVHGYLCTAAAGHPGRHAAYAVDGTDPPLRFLLASWPRVTGSAPLPGGQGTQAQMPGPEPVAVVSELTGKRLWFYPCCQHCPDDCSADLHLHHTEPCPNGCHDDERRDPPEPAGDLFASAPHGKPELAPMAADGVYCAATSGSHTCLASPGHDGDHVPYGATRHDRDLRHYTWEETAPEVADDPAGPPRTETGCKCPGDDCPCETDHPDGLCGCCRSGDHDGDCSHPVAGQMDAAATAYASYLAGRETPRCDHLRVLTGGMVFAEARRALGAWQELVRSETATGPEYLAMRGEHAPVLGNALLLLLAEIDRMAGGK